MAVVFCVMHLRTRCMVTFSQYLPFIKVMVAGAPIQIFGLFPVIWSIAITWLFAGIVQGAGGMDPVMDNSTGTPHLVQDYSKCATSGDIIDASPAFKIPYPGQWGGPIFRGAAIAPMLGSMLVSMVESVGDYYACAQMTGAPPPSGSVIARGLAGEGWGLILCGLFGTSNGTTSYGENIGALAVTKVGSRAVVQTGACVMIVAGLFPKFGAIFASMPGPMVAGLYICLFGMIAACGLSQLQHVDLNSSRNLFILGFCIYNGLSIAGAGGYFKNIGYNPFCNVVDLATGTYDCNDGAVVGLSFFDNPMVISLLAGVFLDNTIPGTPEMRGMNAWAVSNSDESSLDDEFMAVYGLPPWLKFCKNCVYLDFIQLGGKWPKKPEGGYKSAQGDCCNMCCPCIPGCKQEPLEVTATAKETAQA